MEVTDRPKCLENIDRRNITTVDYDKTYLAKTLTDAQSFCKTGLQSLITKKVNSSENNITTFNINL